MEKYDVIVIGAGASGCMAAIQAGRAGKKVLLLEHLDRIGKKLLSTGNGKCNYTNRKQDTNYYRGADPAFTVPVFKQFGFDETIRFFKELGIYPKEKNGYFYPYSEQAASMVDVLQMELKNAGVFVLLSCNITNFSKKKTFYIRTDQGEFEGRCVVFATGLLAGRKTGCDGSAFQYIEKMGHTFIDVVPALVQMKSKDSFLKNLAGIRAEIDMKLLVDHDVVSSDHGELLHIDGGLSGIVSFQVSRYASYGLKQGKQVTAVIDYFPEMLKEQLWQELECRFHTYGKGKTILEAMIGLFPAKLSLAWMKRIGIDANKPAETISIKQIQQLSEQIKECKIPIHGTKDYEDAQVCAGGVDTSQVNAMTLESKLVSGLYFCGELLDVDGMCGGYNLQWAWSSGYVAAVHASK